MPRPARHIAKTNQPGTPAKGGSAVTPAETVGAVASNAASLVDKAKEKMPQIANWIVPVYISQDFHPQPRNIHFCRRQKFFNENRLKA